MDDIEREYERALLLAVHRQDNDLALELITGLNEYRRYYKGDDDDD